MSRRNVQIFVRLLAAVLALSVAGPAAVAGAGRPAADVAGQFDARIAPIAKQVEQIRGLKFEHSVPVRFLSDKAFRKRVTTDDKSLTKQDKAGIKRATESLRALGLISGNVDLFKAVNAKQGSDVLAFYDPDKKDVVVRGTGPVDAATRVTLAHELTHVLQDQHFDLNKTEDGLDKSTTAGDAFKALTEGDAVWVENQYKAKLSAADKKAYDASQQAQVNQSQASTKDVPAIVDVLFNSPYILGPDLVESLRAHGGRAAVDKAFANPPTADAQVLDPSKLILQTTTKPVAAPKPAKGETKNGSADEFGAFGLYLMLASRLPAARAYAAANQWAGDQEITVRAAGKTCVRATFRGRTDKATAGISGGLRAWTAALPPGTATVTAAGKGVELRSCDPGSTVPAPADARLQEALQLLVERDGALNEALRAKATPTVSACFADGLVAEPAFTDLITLEVQGAQVPTATQTALQTAATAVAQHCRDTVG